MVKRLENREILLLSLNLPSPILDLQVTMGSISPYPNSIPRPNLFNRVNDDGSSEQSALYYLITLGPPKIKTL